MSISSSPQSKRIEDILLQENLRYIIPLYQRNYDWGAGEIWQLVRDIQQSTSDMYYLGTLVVSEKYKSDLVTTYEVIDGQQRLTTLCLMLAYINKKKNYIPSFSCPLDYEGRPHFKSALDTLWKGGWQTGEKLEEDVLENSAALLKGYSIIEQDLPKILCAEGGEKCSLEQRLFCFERKLHKCVRLFHVEVPKYTDLNHYFEIMNSRGEQLEQHEVLKAKMIEKLDDAEKDVFNVIWESCSHMDQYVQLGFSSNVREEIFGEQGKNIAELTFDNILQILKAEEGSKEEALPIESIIKKHEEFPKGKRKGERNQSRAERFSSVINFPNFLLHVLWMHLLSKNEDAQISLDDKNLCSVFDRHIKKDDSQEVKNFATTLLQCRVLFDTYVIKRDFLDEKDKFSLAKLKFGNNGPDYVNTFGNESEQKSILMILAAFHVSAPTQTYKYWVSVALRYLYSCVKKSKCNIDAHEYLEYLEHMAKVFMFNIYTAENGKSTTYAEVINRDINFPLNEKLPVHVPKDEIIQPKMAYGSIRNNFIFNYLDYLLWKNNKGTDAEIAEFRFALRDSVEHHYPQNPTEKKFELEEGVLNCFGNLCLVRHSENSRLSNNMPDAKKANYTPKPAECSIKQYLMYQKSSWLEKDIHEHQDMMLSVLLAAAAPAS